MAGSSSSNAADREVELRAEKGDRDAWNTLIERYNRRVIVYLVGRGLRPCEARELAQDVWVRLMCQQREQRLSRIDLPGLALAQARFLHLESVRRHKAVVPLDEARGVHDPTGSERALDRIRLGRALSALDQLGDRDRELFEAAYGPNAPSQAALATTFGLSVQRTKQILCTVRATLRRVLED
ncbi:MAG: sigma-70 family RNA polymerase sigma factor [Myxococcota bacterium]